MAPVLEAFLFVPLSLTIQLIISDVMAFKCGLTGLHVQGRHDYCRFGLIIAR